MVIFSLIATPIVVGTSLFKTSYSFPELHESTYAGDGWETSLEDFHHLVEVRQHWDIAGEIVLDWKERLILPFAYFYDVFTGEFHIVRFEEGEYYLRGLSREEDFAQLLVKEMREQPLIQVPLDLI